ncbi:MAG: L-histidine N(alpha)-methyltransferase [Gammaproteobacteria bacterium]|nr:L-histidine N(alpha)-methyltransferase [Gammaproteobacteria bacterium]
MNKCNVKLNVKFHDFAPAINDFHKEVIDGLSESPRSIPPKYFYDARGSELFDAICEQPEYYPTRTEISLLQYYAREIAEHLGPDCVLVELGSGTSDKVRLLFDALKPTGYMGVDISKDCLLEATEKLARDYPWLEVHAVCADFSEVLEIPQHYHQQQLVAFYPGSSIGNFHPDEAVDFMEQIAQMVGSGGKLLIGVDLKKDEAILNAAYNDAAGITAEFNLNLLNRMREELGAEFKDGAFAHQAFYNESEGRIEMHLVSTTNTQLIIDGKAFTFHLGDSIHTENSYKYSLDEFRELAERAGFDVEQVWTDRKDLFSVQLLKVNNRP